MRISSILFTVLIVAITLISPFVYAEITVNKTPDDVYARVMVLKEEVAVLREESEIKDEWPWMEEQRGKLPRHVLQKTLEILDKINRLRRIRGMGAITVPLYPSREISPDEVFDMVERLVGEINFFLTNIKPEVVQAVSGKSPNDVYRELWGISRA
ncbi:MAG: hypothetical protein GY941_16050 [Planctomycetes bacterium]|nr:hypothetical protein [Planctomycetota bacterium]